MVGYVIEHHSNWWESTIKEAVEVDGSLLVLFKRWKEKNNNSKFSFLMIVALDPSTSLSIPLEKKAQLKRPNNVAKYQMTLCNTVIFPYD